uniref:Signal peptide-containing protein n=1 Tax=Strongyloides venezuelensis TaxID=75913 RepID=A0A0K0G3P9_STRVS
MFKFNIIIFFSILGINFIASELTQEEATEIVQKCLQPLFEGYYEKRADTSFSHTPEYLTRSSYPIRPIKLSIIPPDFHVLLNGGKYNCAKKEIIKLCKLSPVYTFYDRGQKDTYISDSLRERNIQRGRFRTYNRLIGYLPKENGACGAEISITRLHIVNIRKKHVDRTLITPEDITYFKNLNINQRSTFKNNFYYNYFYGWKSNSSDVNVKIQDLRNLYDQTVDGKPIDRTIICEDDLQDELGIQNDEPSDDGSKPPAPGTESSPPAIDDDDNEASSGEDESLFIEETEEQTGGAIPTTVVHKKCTSKSFIEIIKE